jgi:hypothetical protein
MANSITPPPELMQQWASTQAFDIAPAWMLNDVATRAAQWGADHELEACCEWLSGCGCKSYGRELRAARRKPPSLKEQAFKILNPEKEGVLCGTFEYRVSTSEAATIRRALEALPDD